MSTEPVCGPYLQAIDDGLGRHGKLHCVGRGRINQWPYLLRRGTDIRRRVETVEIKLTHYQSA